MESFLFAKNEVTVPPNLQLKILEGFYEQNGVVVFHCYKDRLEHFIHEVVMSRYGDLSGYECSANRIYIDDDIDTQKYEINMLVDIGFACVRQIQALWNTLRQDPCTIILSVDFNNDLGDSVSITFHKKRIGEVMMENLDHCIQPVFMCDNTDYWPYD